MIFNIKMAPKWRFDVDSNRSMNLTKWILREYRGRSQDSSLTLRPSGQKREGWVDLDPVLLVNGRVAKSAKILMEIKFLIKLVHW